MRDIDIRRKIKDSILKKYYDDCNSRVVDELSVSHGIARVDIAVINGSLHGYEIKSEYDTLNRLPNQIHEYSKTFDYITVVTGEKHLSHLIPLLPIWTGIILASNDNGVNLQPYRPALRNVNIDKYSVAQLLWKDETIDVLNELGINKGLTKKNKFFLWKTLSNSTDEIELGNYVRRKLKLRVSWKSEQLPSENDGYLQLSAK